MDGITILISVLGLIGGSIFLYYGAEGLVKGSSSMAIRKGITPLVVGLTIVAFGTSSPELVVSVTAALKGNAAIAIGNVVGSNICNIALILGIAALIRPISVNIKVIKTDIFIMIAVSIILILMILDQNLSRIDGIILFAGIIIYTYMTIRMAKKEQPLDDEFNMEKSKRSKIDFLLIFGGLVILIIGANWFISGAINIARLMGASDIIIGLSIVALGTSLPELATSVVAAIKGEGDISIGNIVGSNIFNILCILGLAAMLAPIELSGIDSVNPIDMIVMLAVAFILLPLAWSKLEISRLEGAFLLFIYIAYMYYMYTYRIKEISTVFPN